MVTKGVEIKNNLKLLASFIVMILCFVAIVLDIPYYKGINLNRILLVILLVASVYFGTVFNEKKRLKKVEGPTVGEVFNNENIPQEFKDEEKKFSILKEKGILDEE